MEICFKAFEELGKEELHEMLRLRSEVFVVEQECAYQDIDGKDQIAIHVLGLKKEELVAYARIFKGGDYFEEAAVGRVLVKKNNRGQGLAQQLMRTTIDYVINEMSETKIKLSAQNYLTQFYKNLGFEVHGKSYLEDGIPHIEMVCTAKS